ncbi:MAG: choice-of-anchor D domain-containing protein [Ignavibacteria bacterium]|nr:choice-of-anchor D domain-containing protein [Ignavibacteria bacterium]
MNSNLHLTVQGTIMQTYRMTITILASIVLSTVGAWAQSINVYGINTSAFPKVTADYVAFDVSGNPITDLRAADFRVQETMQGGAPLDVTASVTHDCKEQDPEASILLILDVSTSMDQVVPGGNKKRIEYAKDALKAFVGKVKFTGNTRVALVTFAGAYKLIVDWTDNPQPVIDSLNKIKNPVGATNYVLPFESNQGFNIYDMFQKRPSNIPRFAIFLTDGHPSPDINDASSTKSETKFVNDNVAKMNGMGIRFFNVTILEPTTHWTLEALSKGTGGKSIVTSEERLVEIYGFLALETQIKKVCQISWISPYSCNTQGQNRTATIAMIRGANPTATVSYVTPASSVARVDVSDPVLFCGDPSPNQSFFANVTLTAQGTAFSASNFTITPSTYFKVVDWNYPQNQTTFAPFSLTSGNKRVLRIQFTQGPSQAFRQAQLTFAGGPCAPSITLVGGTGIILLQSPVGGELTSTCDTVTIKWAGVLPTQPVKIEYTPDGGTNWNVISADATGLQYKWLPPAAGTNYRVRVSVSPIAQYVWAKQLGGAGQDSATSVAVTPSGLKVFATGYYDGATKFGPVTQPSASSNIDGYFVEFDSDGNITTPTKVMLLTGTASNEEKIIGCLTDRNGNYYVAGYFSSPASTFGPFPLTRGARDTRNMFIFKFDSTGALAWNIVSKGTPTQSSHANALDFGLRYDVTGNPEVVVYGKFQRYIELGVNRSGIVEKSNVYNNANDRDYYVIFDIAGYPRFSLGVPPAGFTMKSKRVTDALGFTYETDHYKGPKTFTPPPITLPNAGGTDVYVFKNGASPASADQSKSSFSVKAPTLSVTLAKGTFPQTPQGDTSQNVFAGILKNTGDFDVTIRSAKIVGAHANDFKLISTLVGQRLAAGKSLSIEMMFIPTGIGMRTALLEVVGDCNAQAQLPLEGDAAAPCVWERQLTVDLGKVPLSQPRPFTVTCVLKNTGPLSLAGDMRVVSASPEIVVKNTGKFVLTPGQCFDVQIDVTAAAAGAKTAVINFGLPAECGDAASTIKVEIVEPRVIIDSIDLGRVRLLTPTNGTITISNLNTEEAEVTSIAVVDPTNPHFVFTVPATPQKLAPGATLKIPVVFTPQTRGPLSATVRAIIKGKESSPLIGQVMGVGFLPAIAAVGYTYTPWTVNTQSPDVNGKVVIRNTDSDNALTINDVAFITNDPSFAWTNPLPTFPIVLQPGAAPLELPITFTPQTVGNNVVNVKITHDAKPGPGPVPPYTDTVVVVQGIGKDQSSINPVVFPKTLTCATRVDSFTIENPSFIYDLNCQPPVVTGDVAAITLSQQTGFTLKPGEKKVITVTFQPQVVGPYAAQVAIANDQNLKLNVTISGEGITTSVKFAFGQTPTASVGQQLSLPVVVSYNASDFAGAQPTTFSMTFTHDAEAIRFNSFGATKMAGWTFTPTAAPGRLDVLATSAGAPLLQGDFVTAIFDVFLNANTKLPVDLKVTTPLTCLVTSGDVANVEMKFVCFTVGRLVDFNAKTTGIVRPKNNPVQDFLSIDYTTGIPAPTTIQIINSMGNVVMEATSPQAPSGTYEFTADVSGLASGLYFVRLNSANVVATTTFNIVR